MRVILIVCAAIIAVFTSIAVHALLKLRRRPIEQLYAERARQADFCPLDNIPERMKQLIIQTEDQKFFEHHGLDPEGIRKALRQNLRERQMAAGGSTITQQLIKNLYFHFHKSILRKIEELILVPFVEHMLGKRKILEFYMNIAYFGYGIYGIAGAARF